MARILIIDDSDSVRSTLKNLLTEMKHQVVEAEDGQIALEILDNEQNFDLIMCDVNMPNVNGMEFIEQQSAREGIKSIPTIMCTTESHPKLVLKAKRVGVVRAWLVKPFKAQRLKETLERILPA
ncbi:MAG: response regulator [Bdellovibrionota bacterium]|nr:response regulator [Bdellovibrionota bacterium]MEC8624334.1 response regulator [Bdellovibrionota bacterium]MEE2744320.1 response regulator [Bdellovibrionota bacterium]|tara:strand:- start:247 stop:618 length:372 start_codon:yes stop_codon:yes gene_type:complete